MSLDLIPCQHDWLRDTSSGERVCQRCGITARLAPTSPHPKTPDGYSAIRSHGMIGTGLGTDPSTTIKELRNGGEKYLKGSLTRLPEDDDVKFWFGFTEILKERGFSETRIAEISKELRKDAKKFAAVQLRELAWYVWGIKI